MRDRITVWANRMTEWAPGGHDQEGELAWEQLSEDLAAIESKVDKLWPELVKETAVSEEITIQSLIDEGRLGGALRLARDEAEYCGNKFKAETDQTKLSPYAEELVMACQKLSELGDPLSAAAIIAPQFERFRNISSWAAEEANKILARARTEKTAAANTPSERGIVGPHDPVPQPKPKPKLIRPL